ncbi:hypothetical protein BD311DRAFT_746165 [Dichomitus squalens]|uniref:DRBM domain-containing protein n=1 Tax=Dichomitus squalens TaxID=114155 RepID=A0A4Q9N1T7_9APHY|nr:hypothetical protein BD311DRAFT_746165 [Dichomitus squalens]
MSSNDGTVALNNYLQNKGRAAALHWEDTFTGPRHDGQWTSYCKINGEVIATGTGTQKNAARDAAAREALPILMAQDATEAKTVAE